MNPCLMKGNIFLASPLFSTGCRKKKTKTGRSGITARIHAKNPPLWFHHPTRRALKQLSLPVAVDGDDDDKQHGHDDSGDDDVERQIVRLFVPHRAHDPLAFAKLDLYTNAEWKRDGDDTHRLNARWARAGPLSCWQPGQFWGGTKPIHRN